MSGLGTGLARMDICTAERRRAVRPRRWKTGSESGSLLGASQGTFVTKTILQRIADGDQSAVQECLKSYGGLVWSLARRMLRNTEDAEDAVQEIFLDVWKNAERFDQSQASETTFPFRNSWFLFTPVSRIATVRPLPVAPSE